MSPTYTPTERSELNAVSELLQQYKSLFKYAPDVNSVLVTVCWKMLKRNSANIDDLNHVMASLALEITNYPTVSQMRDELQSNATLMVAEKKVTYSVISRDKVASCNGDLRLLEGRFFSHSLTYTIDRSRLDAYISELKSLAKTDTLFYEIAYCRLFQIHSPARGILKDIPKVTMPKIWRFCGLIKSDIEGFDMKGLIESLVRGMEL